MKNIILAERQISPEAEAEMSQLLKQFGTLQEDAHAIAIHMLASSQSFTSFLHYVQKQGAASCQRTRLVDVGPAFAQQYIESRSSPNQWKATEPWMGMLYRHDKNAVANALGVAEVDNNTVRTGTHSLLTPTSSVFQQGCILLGAATKDGYGIDGNAQDKMFTTLFPRHGSYSADRLKNERLEQLVGMRSGFIHFFLAEDALANMDGIALHSSYYTPDRSDCHIIFTMHERFFFICGLNDLSAWLKTDEARKSYANKIRISGHRYPATVDDLKYCNPSAVFSIEEFVREKAASITKIPSNKLAGSYLSAVDKRAMEVSPHLTWNTPAIAEHLDIHNKILRAMKER